MKLDKHFKAPKWLKVATMNQTRSCRRSMFEAYASYLEYKRRSLTKRTDSFADKAEPAAA